MRQLVLMCVDELTETQPVCASEAGLRLAALAERLRFLAIEEQFQPAIDMFVAIGALDAVDWEEVLDAIVGFCVKAMTSDASAM